jgi:hypothetical protein
MLKILGAPAQNLVARRIRCPGFVPPNLNINHRKYKSLASQEC